MNAQILQGKWIIDSINSKTALLLHVAQQGIFPVFLSPLTEI